MSIQPVAPLSHPGTDLAVDEVAGPHPKPAPERPPAVQPDPGRRSKSESPTLKPSTDTAEMPRDEVQVQRVNGASGDIVIRYLDASGNLILQIPSSQVLGLARAVEQALEEQSHQRTGIGQGEASHGD